MRTVKMSFLLLTLFLLLTGCQRSLIRGNINGNMPFEGTMTSYILEGKSYVQIHTLDRKLFCRGTLMATYVPNLSYACDDEEGSATLDCNNDRVIMTNWHNAGCRQGYAHGWTDHGASVYFDFFPEPEKTICQQKQKTKYCDSRLKNCSGTAPQDDLVHW